MRLVDLDPRWLTIDGRRVGFVFRCPHCQKTYLSCMFEPTPVLNGGNWPSQFKLFEQVLPEVDAHDVVPCNKASRWTPQPPAEQANFAMISVTPSIDASASGHWHGFVTSGEIK